MFNHQQYLHKFLADYNAGQFHNNSAAQIERFPGNEAHYHLIGIHHLTPEENRSKHNLYLDVIDPSGKRLPERIEWGWSGQRQNETANPVLLDKPANEPSGNISIGGFQIVWAKVLGKPSDRIWGVTTGLPDEGPNQWNTWGHHSYYCVFMWTEGIKVPPLPTVPPVPSEEDAYQKGLEVGRAEMKDWIIREIKKL